MTPVLISIPGLLLCIAAASCSKPRSYPPPIVHGKGGALNSALGGMHNFHVTFTYWDRNISKYIIDRYDQQVGITSYTDDSIVMDYPFVYDTTLPGGTRRFKMVSGTYTSWGHLDYYPPMASIVVYQSIHISAGAGNSERTYTSY